MNIKEKAEKRIVAELDPVDLEQLYRDMLDECEPEVKVAGLSFCASRIVEELDPVAFRCGVCDYADSLVNDSITEEISGNHYDYKEAESIVEEVEAEDEDEAWDKAREIDGGDFDDAGYGSWNIDTVEEVTK